MTDKSMGSGEASETVADVELCQQVWQKLAGVWRRMAQIPLSKPDSAVDVFFDEIEALIDFDRCWLVLVHQDSDERRSASLGAVDGWVLAEIFRRPDELSDRHIAAQRKYRRELIAQDPWARAFAAMSGQHRTLRRVDVLGDQPWTACATGRMMKEAGVTDRMMCGHALAASVEVYLGLDRGDGPAFDALDATILKAINEGLSPFLARLAMSFGLFAHQEVLQPRQRETLLLLLDGLSTKDIAARMGLTNGSARQYVLAVYRALGVNSRAELLNAWMDHLDVLSTVKSG